MAIMMNSLPQQRALWQISFLISAVSSSSILSSLSGEQLYAPVIYKHPLWHVNLHELSVMSNSKQKVQQTWMELDLASRTLIHYQVN